MPALPRLSSSVLAAVVLLGLVAGTASAGKPQPRATATLSSRLCELVVGYNWAKFAGKKLTATVGLYERTGAGDVEISSQSSSGQVGRVGMLSYVASLTSDAFPDGRTLVVLGVLTDSQGAEVPGSAAESAEISSTCG